LFLQTQFGGSSTPGSEDGKEKTNTHTGSQEDRSHLRIL
jgi:hypothetical protein